jgi:hypothetical protein
MNIREYAASKDITIFEVFDEAYRWKFGNVCRDGSLVKQAARYERFGVVPWFVGDYMRSLHRQVATIPDA